MPRDSRTISRPARPALPEADLNFAPRFRPFYAQEISGYERELDKLVLPGEFRALTEQPHLLHFLRRRGGRHENSPLHLHFAARVCYALRVVARACTHDPAREGFGCEACHFVIGSADFVRADSLQIFAFEVNIRPVLFRKMCIKKYRCVVNHPAQAFGSEEYVIESRNGM